MANQTYKSHEIIIINDGSTDNTLNICKKYKNIFDNIKIINLEKNMGVSYARNIGIKESSGEYIHFVDSDDFIESNMYSKINNELKNINADIIITETIYNEDEKIKISNLTKQKITSYNEMQKFLVKECIKERRNVFNFVWNKLYKRDFIIKNNLLFNEEISFGEDFLFNCQALKNTNFLYIMDNAYYNYVRRKNQETLK